MRIRFSDVVHHVEEHNNDKVRALAVELDGCIEYYTITDEQMERLSNALVRAGCSPICSRSDLHVPDFVQFLRNKGVDDERGLMVCHELRSKVDERMRNDFGEEFDVLADENFE